MTIDIRTETQKMILEVWEHFDQDRFTVIFDDIEMRSTSDNEHYF